MSVWGVTLVGALIWPGLFWGGAAAVSAPILIHLLARRRFKRLRWAAIQFLLQAERRNRRRVRMEDLILLLLRCCAVVLIALLVARPFFRPEGLAALLGGAERTERIFVVDDSFSMGYLSGDETTFDRAKRAVKQLVELYREQSPGDTITVLRTSALSTPVAAGMYLDARQTEELLARVEGMNVSQFGLSPRDVFQAVRRMLDERPGAVNVAVYVISDFQRVNWSPPGGETGADGEASGGPGPSPIAPLAEWRGRDRGLTVALVDVGDDHARNLAVTDLSSDRSRFVANVEETVSAGISNFTDGSVEALNLETSAGAALQPTVTVDRVPSGETVAVPVSLAFERPGWNWACVALPGDALPVDDQRTLVVPTVEAVRVLIVNGEPSSDTYRDEVTLLATALRPAGEVFSGNEIEIVDETELEDLDLSGFDVVMLANVYRVSEPGAAALARFIAAGGGVGIFLGDQVDPDFYNATLYADGRGILPGRLGERQAPPTGARLVTDDPAHPMVRVLAGTNNPFAEQILFEQYFACTPAEVETDEEPGSVGSAAPNASGQPAADGSEDRSQNTARADARGPGRVVAHFADGEGTPAILERTYGEGRVVMFTSTCDQEWNDWAKDPSFVVAMLELCRHLARGRGVANESVVGGPIELAIDPETYAEDVRVRTPAYPAEQEIALTAGPKASTDGSADPGFWVRWTQTPTSGVYRFVLTRRTGEEEVRAFAVNLDPSESDLRPAGQAGLKQALHEIEVHYVDGLKSLGDVGEDTRREFWKSVLVAAAVVLMGEQFLGWWFGRRS